MQQGSLLQSLGTSFISNAVITLFLYEEGSSLLVLVPQVYLDKLVWHRKSNTALAGGKHVVVRLEAPEGVRYNMGF